MTGVTCTYGRGGGGGGTGRGNGTILIGHICVNTHQNCTKLTVVVYCVDMELISAHLHNLYHDFPELHAVQACFHGKASFEKIT